MRILILLLSTILALPAFGQEYAVHTIADSLRAGAEAVIRNSETELEFRSDKRAFLKIFEAVTLLSPKSRANELTIFYDEGSRVRKVDVELYDAMGNAIRKVDKDEIKDYSAVSGSSLYEDRRVKHVEVRHSTYPFTIVYSYERELEGIDFAGGEDWYAQWFGESVERARFTIRKPAGFPVHYKAYHLPAESEIVADGGDQLYQWEVRNRPVLPYEAYAPSPKNLLPRLSCAPGQVNMDGFEGELSSWEALSQFIYSLWEGRGELPAEVEAAVQQEVAGAATDEEKIARLYRYLQRNMRYVSVQLGIGGWQPFDAAYVADNKYGDCKALTNYMWAMLRAVGIEAYPALIQTNTPAHRIDTALVKSQFNHVLLYLPDQDNWLECTSVTTPPHYIGYGNHGRDVLLVKEKEGALYHTPTLGYLDNIRAGRTVVQLGRSGEAALTYSYQAVAREAAPWRYYKLHYADEKVIKKAEALLSSVPGLSVSAVGIVPSPEEPECTVRIAGAAKRLASKAGKRLFLPLLPVPAYDEVPPENDSRHWPVQTRDGFTYRDTIVHRLPEGFTIESIGDKTTTLEHPSGYYRLEVEAEEAQIQVVRVLQRKAVNMPAAAYNGFRKFWLEVAKLEQSMAVLVEKRT